MNTAPTRHVAYAASVLLLAPLSGCGAISDFALSRDPFLDQSAQSAAEASFADMRDLTSMRILGEVDSLEHGRMTVDLSVGTEGCNGSIEILDSGGFQLRHNEDGTWIRADQDFWQSQTANRRQGDRAWKVVRDKWIAVGDADEIVELCDLEAMLAELELEPDDTAESLSADSVIKVGDHNAVPITGGKGKKRTTLWVSLDEPHHVLKMAPAKDKGLPDALFLEEFGVKVIVETPTRKEIYVLPNGQSPL